MPKVSKGKPLLKKYPSLKQDLVQLEMDLINNPRMGIPLGQDSYKTRLATKSKNKGKIEIEYYSEEDFERILEVFNI